MNSDRFKWERRFLAQAFMTATWSKDRSTKVGAVIAHDGLRVVKASGYNGFPRGVDDDVEERHARPAKYLYTEHAERNAIYAAARLGIAIEGCTLYSTHYPCSDCARGVIQAGIMRVVVPVGSAIPTAGWTEREAAAKDMLTSAGVSWVEVELASETRGP